MKGSKSSICLLIFAVVMSVTCSRSTRAQESTAAHAIRPGASRGASPHDGHIQPASGQQNSTKIGVLSSTIKVAVYGNNSIYNLLSTTPGFSATLVTDSQLATSGFLKDFDVFLYTRDGDSFGTGISSAAADNVRSFVNGNVVLFMSDLADKIGPGAVDGRDPLADRALLNAVTYAASGGRKGYVGEFGGAGAALSHNTSGRYDGLALGLVPGTWTSLVGNGTEPFDIIKNSHLVVSGLPDPWSSYNGMDYLAGSTDIPLAYIVAQGPAGASSPYPTIVAGSSFAISLLSTVVQFYDTDDRQVAGTVCDNLRGMKNGLLDQLYVRLPKEYDGAIFDVDQMNKTGLVNGRGTATDADKKNNVGRIALDEKGRLVYYPPDEFNERQEPTTISQITPKATRLVYLTVRFTLGRNRYVVGRKEIILARPPVVLVHGINSQPKVWNSLKEAISSSKVGGLGIEVPFVSVNHNKPKSYPDDGLRNGNGPVEIGADLLAQRIATTLTQVHEGKYITDSDENEYPDDISSFKYLHPRTHKSIHLAIRHVDVVAWSYGGVITRWYITAKRPGLSAGWYQRPFMVKRKDGIIFDQTNLPTPLYRNDIRKVITVASIWRGAPLANYANEIHSKDGVDFGQAPLIKGFRTLRDIVPKLPPMDVPSMEVMAVNSRWLSQLTVATKPFLETVAYGSVSGDNSKYLLRFPGFGDQVNPYGALDYLQTPTWFPYLALERRSGLPVIGGANDYSDGLVPLWSSTIPGTVPDTSILVSASHHNIVEDDKAKVPDPKYANPKTRDYLVGWLNNATLPQGKALNRWWNLPVSSRARDKQWTFKSGEMAPGVQNSLYLLDGRGIGRLNPAALKEFIHVAEGGTVKADPDSTSVTISWKAAVTMDTNIARVYILTSDGLVKVGEEKSTTPTKEPRITIRKLRANTTYYFEVESRLNNPPDGFSARSEQKEFKTKR